MIQLNFCGLREIYFFENKWSLFLVLGTCTPTILLPQMSLMFMEGSQWKHWEVSEKCLVSFQACLVSWYPRQRLDQLQLASESSEMDPKTDKSWGKKL